MLDARLRSKGDIQGPPSQAEGFQLRQMDFMRFESNFEVGLNFIPYPGFSTDHAFRSRNAFLNRRFEQSLRHTAGGLVKLLITCVTIWRVYITVHSKKSRNYTKPYKLNTERLCRQRLDLNLFLKNKEFTDCLFFTTVVHAITVIILRSREVPHFWAELPCWAEASASW
jgi:hypothetical protein